MRLAAFVLSAISAASCLAGPLTPPAGPVTSTIKPLSEIEPRTLVSAANTPASPTAIFRISQPGSYYLGANIPVGAGRSGIEVTVADVTIDLNGFGILGSGGSLDGITLTAGVAARIRVHNGRITGCGRDGINGDAAGPALFDHLQILSCSRRGIAINSGSIINHCTVELCGGLGGPIPNAGIATSNSVTVRDCQVNENFGTGIACGTSSVVIDTQANGNTGHGIDLALGSSARGCTADGNTANGINIGNDAEVQACHARLNANNGISVGANSTVVASVAGVNANCGISVSQRCVVSQCTADGNGTNAALTTRDGINAADGSVITECSTGGNGRNGVQVVEWCVVARCASLNNAGSGIVDSSGGSQIRDCVCTLNVVDGISAASDSVVTGNSCDNSGGIGIRVTGGDVRVESNHCTDNGTGIFATATGSIFLRNTCSGNTTNYNIAAANVGIFVTATPMAAAVNGSTGGTAPGSTDPSVNWSF